MIQQRLETLLIVKTVNNLSGCNTIGQSHEQLNIKAVKTLHHGSSSHVPLKKELKSFKWAGYRSGI